MWTLVRKTDRTDEPATTEEASAPEPAAESPIEAAEDEIADKAEELNIEVIMAVGASSACPTRRRETTGALEPVDIQENDDPGTAKQSVFEVLQE